MFSRRPPLVHKTDPPIFAFNKEFYSYVNNKTTVRTEIAVLKNRDGELAILPHEKAEMLNTFFASVFTKEDTANIPEPESKVLQSMLSTIIVTEQMVRDRLKEQKPGKSAGPDGNWYTLESCGRDAGATCGTTHDYFQ